MPYLKRDTIIGILFVLLTGTITHFLYDWSGNNKIIGFFTPVNESIWEHMKLLFFPMLIYALLMIYRLKKQYPCITSSVCAGISAGTLLIPLFFYTYIYLTGKDIFLIDISIFIAGTITAFWISYRLTISCRLAAFTSLLCGIVCILAVCFILFTYHPPDNKLFQDPELHGMKALLSAPHAIN